MKIGKSFLALRSTIKIHFMRLMCNVYQLKSSSSSCLNFLDTKILAKLILQLHIHQNSEKFMTMYIYGWIYVGKGTAVVRVLYKRKCRLIPLSVCTFKWCQALSTTPWDIRNVFSTNSTLAMNQTFTNNVTFLLMQSYFA